MKYYNYEDLPATWEEGKFPRLFVGGQEHAFYDLNKFGMYAQPISKKEFDQLVAEQQASGEQ